jgi:hypothetical protein
VLDDPRMTSRGRMIAFFIAVAGVLALPKKVTCPRSSSNNCGVYVEHEGLCTPYETMPLGFYLLSSATGHDFGVSYSAGNDCH